MSKKITQFFIIALLLFTSLAATGKAEAWSGCGGGYVVKPGDTLFRIAAYCGVTRDEIRMANPGLIDWVYIGEILVIPGAGSAGDYQYGYYQYGGEQIHIVTYGDTLRTIANQHGVSMDEIARTNGIYDYNYIYIGQRLRIPLSGYVEVEPWHFSPPQPPLPPPPQPAYGTSTYVVQRGDSLKNLAGRWGVGIYDILAVNPQIVNASLIYAGQVINIPNYSVAPVPASPGYYTVQQGDTLRIIANMYGTTVYDLQLLNPQIWNPNWIYTGMVIRVY